MDALVRLCMEKIATPRFENMCKKKMNSNYMYHFSILFHCLKKKITNLKQIREFRMVSVAFECWLLEMPPPFFAPEPNPKQQKNRNAGTLEPWKQVWRKKKWNHQPATGIFTHEKFKSKNERFVTNWK